MTEVRVGQVWKDWDKRYRHEEPGRLLRVEAIVRDKAVVRSVYGGKRTRIRLDRFKPTNTGYRLVRDVDGGE